MSPVTGNLLIGAAIAILLGGCGSGSSAESSLASPVETALDTVTPPPAAPTYDLGIITDALPPDSTAAFAEVSFSAPDAASYECLFDGESIENCQSPLLLMPLSEGEHHLQIRALASDNTEGDWLRHSWQTRDIFEEGDQELIATEVMPSPTDNQSWRGILRINCDFAHSSYNDPIVFPGQENAAHLHRFYGNTLADHDSTAESLLTTGESSCQGNSLNRSAYWMPSLLAPAYDLESGERLTDENGEPAWQVVKAVVGNDEVAHEIFYYSAAVDDLESIQPVPVGLRIIAGNPMAMPGMEQDTSIVRWHCQSWGSDDSSNPRWSTSIPICRTPDRLRLDIFFPSCWNGTDLDAADHKSHMAYPSKNATTGNMECPSSHPVALARPSFHYAFPVKPENEHPTDRSTRGWRLAADMYEVTDTIAGGVSLHGDWFNAWHPQIMEAIVEGCIQQRLDCHDGNLGNGYRLSGTRPGSQQEAPIVNDGLGY